MAKKPVPKSKPAQESIFKEKVYVQQPPPKKKELSTMQKLMGVGRKQQRVKF